jgi:hypothetical protein
MIAGRTITINQGAPTVLPPSNFRIIR